MTAAWRKRGASKGLKARIWFETFGRVPTVPCHWCQKPLTFKESTLDHEPPLSDGGTWRCCVLACLWCNRRRDKDWKNLQSLYRRF